MLISKDNFINYLRKEGYSEWSANGNETTISKYIYWIERVMRYEMINDWSELTNHIQHLLIRYGEFGEMKSFGQEGHSTVINALRRFMDYLLNECGFVAKTGIFYV